MVLGSTSMAGRVVLITGLARGQGRAHAVRLASEGADIVGLDICADIASVDYPGATPADLAETVRLVQGEGRRIVAHRGDVREPDDLERLVQAAADEFGRLDALVANAGIVRYTGGVDRRQSWRDIIDINLTGVWNTVEAALPLLRQGERGGSIVITSSIAGLKAMGDTRVNGGAYSVAKRGLVALMELLARELASESIRVNTIHPTGVMTGMTDNATVRALAEGAASGETNALSALQNALPVQMLPPEDVAAAVAWLLSDEARYITGVALPVDAGFGVR